MCSFGLSTQALGAFIRVSKAAFVTSLSFVTALPALSREMLMLIASRPHSQTRHSPWMEQRDGEGWVQSLPLCLILKSYCGMCKTKYITRSNYLYCCQTTSFTEGILQRLLVLHSFPEVFIEVT